MSLRIVAGRLRGRRLASPRWSGLRPTSDRLRETVFDILERRVAGACVLDAYAGTGALGIEALSRGAAHVTFVDRDRRAVALIGDNLRRCGVTEGYAIIRADVHRAASTLSPRAFDVILLDPPYDVGRFDEAIGVLARLVAEDGVIVLEHTRRRAAPPAAGGLVRVREVRAGDSALSFYEREQADA